MSAKLSPTGRAVSAATMKKGSTMTSGGTDRNPVEVLCPRSSSSGIRRGEAVTPEEYAEEHPELADEILALFPALLMMEDLGGETRPTAPARSPAERRPDRRRRPPAGWASSACSARSAAAAWASSTRPSRSRSAAAWR